LPALGGEVGTIPIDEGHLAGFSLLLDHDTETTLIHATWCDI